MCATPRPKHTKVLGALTGDEAAHTAFAWAAVGHPMAVAALPAAVAKKARKVNDAAAAGGAEASKECSWATAVANTSKTLVVREAKASKECSPETADVAAPAEVIAAPAPIKKAPSLYHPTGMWWRLLGQTWVTWDALVRSTANAVR